MLVDSVLGFFLAAFMLFFNGLIFVFYLLRHPTFPRIPDKILAVGLPFCILGYSGILLCRLEPFSGLTSLAYDAVYVGLTLFLASLLSSFVFGYPAWMATPSGPTPVGGDGGPPGARQPDRVEANDNGLMDRPRRSRRRGFASGAKWR